MNANWPTIKMPCLGVSPDYNQNIWGFSMQTSTRALIDKIGGITQPIVDGAPQGNNRCPAGDSCPNLGAEVYSDNAFWWSSGFGSPQGRYQMLVRGCTDEQGAPRPTMWGSLSWEGDVPPNTTLAVHARSGTSSNLNDPSWSQSPFTIDVGVSPICLQEQLTPNVTPDGPQDVRDGWLMVELVFKTQSQNATPRLKSFQVGYRCLP